ncbi:MAG: hypothetical protein ACKV1O_16165 [Saprospiraceae bacterium]
MAAEDIRWMLQLTAPCVHAVNAYMYCQCELDRELLNRCQDILIKTLEGGKQLTRNALNEAFREQGIIAQGHRRIGKPHLQRRPAGGPIYLCLNRRACAAEPRKKPRRSSGRIDKTLLILISTHRIWNRLACLNRQLNGLKPL